jgi:hypothetical protein
VESIVSVVVNAIELKKMQNDFRFVAYNDVRFGSRSVSSEGGREAIYPVG